MRRFMEIHRVVFHPHIRSSVRVMRENKRKAIFCEQRRDHNGAQFFHKRANPVGVKAPAHLTYRTRTNATRKGEIVDPCICRKSFFSTLFARRTQAPSIRQSRRDGLRVHAAKLPRFPRTEGQQMCAGD